MVLIVNLIASNSNPQNSEGESSFGHLNITIFGFLRDFGGNPCRKKLIRQTFFPTHNTEFYRQILGVDTLWKIDSMDLQMEAKQVDIQSEVDQWQR